MSVMALDFFAELRQFDTNKKSAEFSSKIAAKNCSFCLNLSFLSENAQFQTKMVTFLELGFLAKCLNSIFGNIV